MMVTIILILQAEEYFSFQVQVEDGTHVSYM